VTGASEWHINADEPDVLDYDTSFKPASQDALYEVDPYRTSDHDPVLVGLDLDAPPTIVVNASASSCIPSGGVFGVIVGDLDTAAGDLTLALTDNDNETLVPNGNVEIGGSGANRTISITGANKQSGTAVLTFTVGDGVYSTDLTITVQIGTDLHETLTGTAGVDLILGQQGIDTISGLGGADVLCGGNGNDSISGGDGDDVVDGEFGNDGLDGGADDDVLRGGRGIDMLTGGDGADAFSGGAGLDVPTDFDAGEGDTSDGT
jgi:Ca2+-binding RTX toxin-like protein